VNDLTRRALLELNRRFYSRFAAGFSASRERPWAGWDRLLELLSGAAGGALRVLDAGCGNGRFGAYLAARVGEIDYLGIDGCGELLRLARRRLAAGRVAARWAELELAEEALGRRLGEERFDLVALFGVLHHVPGRRHRARLMARLAAHVDAGGLLAASVWRFDREARLASKVLPWDDYNRGAELPVDVRELEPGDHLLTWAGDRATPRYCHLVGEDEVAELAAVTGLACRARFAADGPGGERNLYLVFAHPASPRATFPPRPSAPLRRP
jgi:SAM-dependent methyltransferase